MADGWMILQNGRHSANYMTFLDQTVQLENLLPDWQNKKLEEFSFGHTS